MSCACVADIADNDTLTWYIAFTIGIFCLANALLFDRKDKAMLDLWEKVFFVSAVVAMILSAVSAA